MTQVFVDININLDVKTTLQRNMRSIDRLKMSLRQTKIICI